MVLPVGGGAGEPGQAAERQADQLRVAAGGGDALAEGADEVGGLVEPDRDLRVDALDQVAGDPRLGLGERVRAGVLGVAAPSDRLPAGGEVAIQVDTVGVTRVPACSPSGFRSWITQRLARVSKFPSSCCVTAMPALSVPWMQPTTRIVRWLSKSP